MQTQDTPKHESRRVVIHRSMLTRFAQQNPAAAAERAPLILEPGAGEAVWFNDNLVTVKLGAKDGAPYGLVESRIPAGSSTPFHRHEDEDEGFYVLEGTVDLVLEGGRRVQAHSGTYVHFPSGVAHGFRAVTDLRLLVLSDPNGFVEMVREAGVAAARRELPPPAAPDLARLQAACDRHNITLLGPLPE